MLLLLVDFACILLVTVYAVRALRLPSRPARIVAGYLCTVAQIVVVGNVLGLIGHLDVRWFLLSHAAAAAVVLARASVPRPRWPRIRLADAVTAARRHPAVTLLLCAVVGAYSVGFLLALLLPPNNWDSMTYHLSRVGYWLQQRAFYPPWNPSNVIQTMYPVGAEVLLLWIVLCTGSDAHTCLVQWTAAVAGMIAIFGTARLWRATRAQAGFAALVWASFPEIMLQSTSTQNDLTAAVFLLAGCYFCMIGLLANHRNALLLSGLGIGLAIGTKITVLLALPGIVAAAALLWQRRRLPWQRLTLWATACAASVGVLALHTFVANAVVYGHPFGPGDFRRETSAGHDFGPGFVIENTAKYLYQAADLTGVYVPWRRSLAGIKAAAGEALFAALSLDPNRYGSERFPPFTFEVPLPTHEDLAWFGPLGFFLLLPVTAWQAIQAVRRGREARALVAAGAVSFALIAVAWLRWQPWNGRYFVVAVTLAAPLLACAYSQRPRTAMIRAGIALVAAMCLIDAVLDNTMKPLHGPSAIWGRDRVALQTVYRPRLEPVLRALERDVPPGSRIGTMVHDDWDYPAFGRHFDRTVLPLAVGAPTRAALAHRHLDYVLLRTDLQVSLADVVDERVRSWAGGNMILVELAPREPSDTGR